MRIMIFFLFPGFDKVSQEDCDTYSEYGEWCPGPLMNVDSTRLVEGV